MDGGVILGLLIAPLALWAALIVVLWLVRPRNVTGRSARRCREHNLVPSSDQVTESVPTRI